MMMGKNMIQKTLLAWVILFLFSAVAFAQVAEVSMTDGSQDVKDSSEDISSVLTEESSPSAITPSLISGKIRAAEIVPNPAKTGQQSTDIREIQRHALPSIVKVSVSRADIEHTLRSLSMKKVDVAAIEDARCAYQRNGYVMATSFDCSQGIAALDDKATPMYASRLKPAVVEVSFDTKKKQPEFLQVATSAEFPEFQHVDVFYRNAQTNNNWRLLASDLSTAKDAAAHQLDISELAQEDLGFRVEGYLNKRTAASHDGSALWSVNSIELLDSTEQHSEDQVAGGSTPIDPEPVIQNGPDPQLLLLHCLPGQCPSTPIPSSFPLDNLGGQGGPGVAPATTVTETPSTPGVPGRPVFRPLPSTDEQVTPVETGQQQQPLPITGAAIANFLRENRSGLGLTLLIVAILGTMGYRHYRAKNSSRRH